MSLNLEVEVDVPFTFDYEALAGEVVAFTIDHEGFPYEAEVNLTLTDNEGIHEINRMYGRLMHRRTFCLSRCSPMSRRAISRRWKRIMRIILIRIPGRSCWETLSSRWTG